MQAYNTHNITNHFVFYFNLADRQIGARDSSGDIRAGCEAVMRGNDPLLRASVGWDAHSAARSL